MEENKKLMVVDDDPAILFTVETLFEDEDDIEVISVESGPECLERMEEGFEGVVLMDIMMPDMDGWETVKVIAERYDMENVVISMLTAKSSPGEERRNLQKYVVDYIRKPFTPEELKSKVKEYKEYLD